MVKRNVVMRELHLLARACGRMGEWAKNFGGARLLNGLKEFAEY